MRHLKKILLAGLIIPVISLTSCQTSESTGYTLYDSKEVDDATYYIYQSNEDSSYIAKLEEYDGDDSEFVIPDTITYDSTDVSVIEIMFNAFTAQNTLETITLGANIKTIGYSAFMSCKSLNTVYLNEGLTTIDGYAFAKSSITTITIPESVTDIEPANFLDCTNLESVILLSKDISIGKESFSNNTSFKYLYFYGTKEEYETLNINDSNNTYLTSDTIYYYSETKPIESGNYWYYNQGNVEIWN